MIVIQDFQDASKVRKDLHVYSTSAQHGVKVREDLNSYRLNQDGQDYQDGQDEEAIARACPSPTSVVRDRLIPNGRERALSRYRARVERRQLRSLCSPDHKQTLALQRGGRSNSILNVKK